MLWKGKGTFAAGHMEPGQLAEGMHRHHEEVKRTVPAGRLLVWSVTDGWEPLCEFLGCRCPTRRSRRSTTPASSSTG